MQSITTKIYSGAPAMSATNLLSNPGFETAGAGGADVFGSWLEKTDYSPDSNISDEGVLVHGGAHACQLDNTISHLVYVQQFLSTIPGHRYRLSVWTRGDGSNSGRFAIFDETHVSDIIPFAQSCGITGTAYVRFTYDFTAPAGCVLISLSLAAPSGVGTAYFDDVSVTDLDASNVPMRDDWNGFFSDAGVSVTFPIITVNQPNRILLVGVGTKNNVAVASVTYNGDALTLYQIISANSDERLELWYRLAPDIGTFNVVVTLASAEKMSGGAIGYYNVNQDVPFRAVATGGGV